MKPHEEWLFKAENDVYLNPYSTLYRYPDGDLMPPKVEVIKAIAVAERILDFVKIKISL